MRGGLRQHRAAGICLGKVLSGFQIQLGFGHGANRAAPCGQFVHTGKSWNDWLLEKVGFTNRTARRYIKRFEFALVAAESVPVAKAILKSEAVPTETDLETLAGLVELLEPPVSKPALEIELGCVQEPPMEAGEADEVSTGKVDHQKLLEHAAIAHFSGIPRSIDGLAKRICGHRDMKDYTLLLGSLPLATDDEQAPSLYALERSLSELFSDESGLAKILHDVRAAISNKETAGREAAAKSPRHRLAGTGKSNAKKRQPAGIR
jgi:hypothetical protein